MKQSEGWDTVLITKLKSNLTAKIFLITCLLLILACVLTYGFIAWAMPMSYTASRTQILAVQTEQLIEQLKQTTLPDCDQMLFRFAVKYDAEVSITDYDGNTVKATYMDKDMSVFTDAANDSIAATQAIGDSFSFADSTEVYQLIVVSSMQAVNQAVETLGRIGPQLLAVILLISILSSLFYARFITRPIMQISGISEKMSSMDFTWSCAENRTDEIGVLAHSLNELAKKLSATMDELQKANASLQADIDRERELEQARLDFFSAVSHELKTPITIIKGQLSGMLDGVGAYADRDKYLARSLTVVRQMEGLVQELLTISRIEKGSGELQAEPVNLAELVRLCVLEYTDLFEQKEQRLYTEISEDIWGCADPNLLKKALRNVLSNASIYSPPEAEIYVAVKGDNTGTTISVENAGVKISVAALPHLFDAFYRVEASRNRQTGGSGLGLYLTKMILEKYGGTIHISNTERGVMTVIHLPAIA